MTYLRSHEEIALLCSDLHVKAISKQVEELKEWRHCLNINTMSSKEAEGTSLSDREEMEVSKQSEEIKDVEDDEEGEMEKLEEEVHQV